MSAAAVMVAGVRGSFPAASEAGNSSRDVGLLYEFAKGVVLC